MDQSMTYRDGDYRVAEICPDCGEPISEVYTKRMHYMLDRSGKTGDWVKISHTTSDCLSNLKNQIEQLKDAVDALKNTVWNVEG